MNKETEKQKIMGETGVQVKPALAVRRAKPLYRHNAFCPPAPNMCGRIIYGPKKLGLNIYLYQRLWEGLKW